MLKLEKVTKIFLTESVALEEVSFHLEKGEFVHLLGPNRVGKTALLRLIAAQDRPTQGEIIFDGLSSRDMEQKQIPLWRRKLGLILEDPGLVSEMNVFDNVALSLRILGEKEKKIKRKVRGALDAVGLLTKSRTSPVCLSSAEKQKTSIARAIVRNPLLLLADEPTANLDEDGAQEITDLLGRVNLFGTAVLLASTGKRTGKVGPGRVLKIDKGKVL